MMGFEYSQSTGHMTEMGELVGVGYSGNGTGLNKPEMQSVRGHGPIPQGIYTIGGPTADAKVGPAAMRLTPDPGNEMFGRADFLIHGDNAAMNHTASDGCIILPHDVRVRIGHAVLAGDNCLTVLP